MTNDVNGEALVLERRPGLISRPSIAPQPKPFQQWATFSGNVGGPIIKDKLFYFASAEYEPASRDHYPRERVGASHSVLRPGLRTV
jgi:hypothetical protein